MYNWKQFCEVVEKCRKVATLKSCKKIEKHNVQFDIFQQNLTNI